ncbi:ras guanine nucleotide exchange factor domain-containing protein [Lipomyces chichibuensis]|uniref:ras guanine nucleotide exchange factor domain-containing protein n=1 Tax=Lipomyces chichibuensis TaxID=1546026 RepID=UPI0033436A98
MLSELISMDTGEGLILPSRRRGRRDSYTGSLSSLQPDALGIQRARSVDHTGYSRPTAPRKHYEVDEPVKRLANDSEFMKNSTVGIIARQERPSTPSAPIQLLPSSPPKSQGGPRAAPPPTPKSFAKQKAPSTPQSRGRGSKSPIQWKSPRSKLSRYAGSRSRAPRHSLTSSSPYNWTFPTPNATSRFSIPSRLFSPLTHVTSVIDADAAAAAVPIQYNSAGDMIGITPARLIIHITSPESLDYNLLSDFFISYRQFMTDHELLRLLTARYKWAVNRSDDIGRVIRLRIFVAIRHWILNYFADDFVPSLGLRKDFVAAINEFSKYGKVRASSGDRRLLGELKRCWIRACSFYWDMPAGVYSSNVLMLGPERCFDERLHPGGSVGTRHVVLEGNNKIKISQSETLPNQANYAIPDSAVATIQLEPQREQSSSPILPRNGLYMTQQQQSTRLNPSLSGAASLSSSLSNESAASVDEPRTPPAVAHGWLWGCLIRGSAKAIVDIPTDDQSIVDAIIPPSPTPVTQRHHVDAMSEHSYSASESSDIGGNFNNNPKVILKSWRKRMFRNHQRAGVGERVPPIVPDFAVATQTMDGSQINKVHREHEMEYMGVRIDILAASVVDNHKQYMATCDEIGTADGNASREFSTSRSVVQGGLGLGVRTGYSSVLQGSPSRTIRTTHNDTDIKSLRGTVIDFHDDKLEAGTCVSTPQELGSSVQSQSLDRTATIRQLFRARFPYDHVIVSGSVASQVGADRSQSVSNPSSILHFPEFSPSHSSTSDSLGSASAIQLAEDFPGLRHRAAKSDLKAGRDISPTSFKWTSTSTLGGTSFNGDDVTRYSLPLIVGPLQRVQESAPLAGAGQSKSANMLIPGISEDIAKEILKLAEIPDDSCDGENAVDIALQKLEGNYRPNRLSVGGKPNGTVDADSCSIEESVPDDRLANFSCRRVRGSERNAWFLEGRALDYSLEAVSDDASPEILQPPSSPAFRQSYQSTHPSHGLSIYSERLSRLSVNSMASGASSTVSLSIHLPFILKYRAFDLAEQFTIIDRDALSEVDWKELIELRWKQNVAPVQDWLSLLTVKDVRGVELIISRFNLMTSWVTSEIMLTRGLEERVRTIVKFIHVAAHTRELQNYSTFMQLTLALASATVQRLQTTWQNVPPGDVALFQSLEELASPLKNFHNLRRAMDKSDVSKGCVPFIGLYLSDLTFNAERPVHVKPKLARDSLYSSDEESDDVNDVFSPSRREDNASNVSQLINVERFRTSASIIKKLLYFVNSARAYNGRLKTNPDIVSRCLYISCLDDDEIEECFQLMESP